MVKDADNMTKKSKVIMAALKAAEADLEAFQVRLLWKPPRCHRNDCNH